MKVLFMLIEVYPDGCYLYVQQCKSVRTDDNEATFYKPVLVLFFVSKRNLFLPNKFLVRKQNKDGLHSCFATNTVHVTSMQAECKKAWL